MSREIIRQERFQWQVIWVVLRENEGRYFIIIIVVFQATFEGWMEVMEDAIDATKVGNIYLCLVNSAFSNSTNTRPSLNQHDFTVRTHTILHRRFVITFKSIEILLRKNQCVLK